MKRNSLTGVVPLLIVVFTGCHEADVLLAPIQKTTEELNATAAHLSVPILDDVPYADVHFKGRKIVLEHTF